MGRETQSPQNLLPKTGMNFNLKILGLEKKKQWFSSLGKHCERKRNNQAGWLQHFSVMLVAWKK